MPMSEITFVRGETRIVEDSEFETRELQYVTPTVDNVVMAALEWEAVVADATIAEHIAWLHRNGLLKPPS